MRMRTSWIILLYSFASGVAVYSGYFLMKLAVISQFNGWLLFSSIALILLCILLVFKAYSIGGKASIVYPVSTTGQIILIPLYKNFLHEQITVFHIIGIGLMICGCFIISADKK